MIQQIPIAVLMALILYAGLHISSFSLTDSVDVFSLVSEGGIATALILLLFMAASVKDSEGIVWLFLVGLTGMSLAAVTDVLDEMFIQPKLLTTFAEDVAMLLGVIFVVEGAYKWLQYNEKIQKTLREKAALDVTTGVYNRKTLFEKAYLEMERSRRLGLPLSLVIIDVDHYHSLDSKYGHHYADDIMVDIARKIKHVISAGDIICRWSIDKFVLLVPASDDENCQLLAEKIRTMIDSNPVLDEDKDIHVTVSIGIGKLHTEDACIEQVIDRADHAAEHSKEKGNCVSLEQAA